MFIAAYCSYALRCFYMNQPLNYGQSAPEEARIVVEQWYESTDDVPPPSMTARRVLYALLHPHTPTNLECLVIYDSNEILVYSMSLDRYVARFEVQDGGWVEGSPDEGQNGVRNGTKP